MRNHTKALATAAALSMTGCSLFSPHPATGKTEMTSAEREAQIEAIFGKPGERKNVQFGQAGDAAPIIDTIPIPKVPAATRPQPQPTVADVIPRAPTPPEPGPTAMGTIDAATLKAAAEPTMDQLVALLRKQVQAAPKSLSQTLALELLELSAGGKVDDLTGIGVSSNDNRMVSDLAAAIQAIASVASGPNMSLAERAAPLVRLAKSWETAADLKIPKVVLASRVDSFGIYTPVDPKFPAGKRSVVIIYCEVANFTSEKSGEEFVTHLTQQDTLITSDGLLVWRPNPEQIEDRCRNQRHDFYLIKKLTLPETLAVGKYSLHMTVTDTLGNKTDTGTLDIEIVK